MKLSTRSRYAARAIIEIAIHGQEKPVTRKTICETQKISASYLENILIILKNHGIIKTTRGPKGGYTLAKKPVDIAMYDIVSIFEGSISAVHCVDDPTTCERINSCPTKFVWQELMLAEKKVLKSFTIERLMKISGDTSILDFSI